MTNTINIFYIKGVGLVSIRTDLAVEAHELSRGEAMEIEGVRVENSEHGSIKKSVVDVINEDGANAIGKMIGRYVTIGAPELKYSLDDYETVCNMLKSELREMCGDFKKTLVVGLGNRAITPDALGAEVVDKLIVTAHLKENLPDMFGDNYSSVYAFVPGVMGTTGIDTTQIVKGVVEKIKPQLVIAVDALAGADINRVSTTIQLADTGIAPGSGVGNHRDGLNLDSLGVKVVAVGVPTVIAAELIGGDNIKEEYKSLMVTTKDIDLEIKRMSKAIANGINMALHKDITMRDVEELVG